MKKVEDKFILIDKTKQMVANLKEEIRQFKKKKINNLFEESFADKLDYKELKNKLKMTKIVLRKLEK